MRQNADPNPDPESLADRMAKVREDLKKLEVEFGEVLPDEVVDDKIAKLVDGTTVPKPQLDEFESKMAEIEQRLTASREVRAQKTVETRRAQAADGKASRGLGFGLSIAYTIIGFPVVGAGVGMVLDRGVEPKLWTSWGALIGSVLGLVGAAILLQRANREE